MKFPLALFVYNRPAILTKTLERLSQCHLSRLYIFADGPKDNDPQDASKCKEVRSLVEKLDWACEVVRVYNPKNQGLKSQIEDKLSFLFSREDAAVILEDDCLPEKDFFRFCEDGLS